MRQLSREEAIAFHDDKLWEGLSLEERAKFQIRQDKLCMPFSVFHEAIEKTLKRPVFTHEFGLNREGLEKELFEGKEPPTFDEILNLLSEDKTILVVSGDVHTLNQTF